MYKIEAMSLEYAETIQKWKYPNEYSIYNFESDEDIISELMNGEYFACINKQDNLVGYFCFGFSAQIPTEENYMIDTDIMDIGLGLCPELCGQGYGKEFMKSGMRYAANNFNARELRLVVADFNKRAISLYRNCGFTKIRSVKHKNTKTEFIVMKCTL